MRPAKARTDPQDKSSIPPIISNVSPKARMVVTDICAEIFARFLAERKFSLRKTHIKNITTSTK
jgi:hypothetical protein